MALFSGANRYPLPHGDGETEEPIPASTWRKLGTKLERMRGERGDAIVGTIRLITSNDGSWLLTDHERGRIRSVCDLSYLRTLQKMARREGREALVVYYDPLKRYWQDKPARGLRHAILFK